MSKAYIEIAMLLEKHDHPIYYEMQQSDGTVFALPGQSMIPDYAIATLRGLAELLNEGDS